MAVPARECKRGGYIGPLPGTLQYAASVRPECPAQSNRRRAMKVPLRSKTIGMKLSKEEFAALEAAARAVLVAAPGLALPGDDAALAGRVTLAEVLALRTLFVNLQFRQAQGPMTAHIESDIFLWSRDLAGHRRPFPRSYAWASPC